MCGLVGFISWSRNTDKHQEIIETMADAIAHRGPDDVGYFCDAETGYSIGFRRLAIIDTSPTGHQPMFSATGRYVLVMNGEIYNFPQMREYVLVKDPGHQWVGHSDTEILLANIELFGWDETIRKTVGMYAIALYDRAEKELHLARDRFGEKPMYYGHMGNSFLFGAELKALAKHPSWQPKVDGQALQGFLSFGYVPTPLSIYEGIFKMEPGTYITFQCKGQSAVEKNRVRYWSVEEAARAGLAAPFSGSEEEALEELEALLAETIKRESTADVPVGAFLSGGVDSSLVVAVMQKYSGQQVKTFTIGNEHKGYDEAGYAKKIADYLGTCHTEQYVSKSDMLAVVPKLAHIYDEPFSDSSQIPTYLVSKMARERVTVSLSGDGGDEVFGGYTRYLIADRIWRRIQKLPRPMRATGAGMLRSMSEGSWDTTFEVLKFLPRVSHPGSKAHKLARMLKSDTFDSVYRKLISTWEDPDRLLCHGPELPYPIQMPSMPTHIEGMMVADSLAYLPDDILVKVDRATMANSLESRAPYLDHRIAEFAWRLPLSMKIQNGNAKAMLKNLLAKHLPPDMFERPKMGFGIPIGTWLRTDLRGWAEQLMNEATIWDHEYLNRDAAKACWLRFIDGKNEPPEPIWNLLMLADWHQQNMV